MTDEMLLPRVAQGRRTNMAKVLGSPTNTALLCRFGVMAAFNPH